MKFFDILDIVHLEVLRIPSFLLISRLQSLFLFLSLLWCLVLFLTFS